MWSDIDYNYEAVNLSIHDYKVVTKLKGRSSSSDIQKTKEVFSNMYMFEHNPI